MDKEKELHVLIEEEHRSKHKIQNLCLYRDHIQKAFQRGQMATGVCALVTIGAGFYHTPVAIFGALAGVISVSASSYYLQERDQADQTILEEQEWTQKLDQAILKREESGVVSFQDSEGAEPLLEEKVGLLLDVMYPEGMSEEEFEQVNEIVKEHSIPVSMQEKVLGKFRPKRRISQV